MRFWLGKAIGFVLGMLLGIGIVLVPAVVERLLHPNTWTIDAHALGPRMGFMYGILWTLPLSFLVGLFFGVIGQAWGGRWQEAANQKKAQTMAPAVQTENVWPPSPTRGNTDDT